MKSSSPRLGLTILLLVFGTITSGLSGHPGSGIVVDELGQVFFMDTGKGPWKVDVSGKLVALQGPPFHWMAVDPAGNFSLGSLPQALSGDVTILESDPVLILGGDFPLTVGSDGALYYPRPYGDDAIQILRLTSSGTSGAFATVPGGSEIDEYGREIRAQWVHGLAPGPRGSLYYTEQRAVRRISADGTVSLVAGDIQVPDCVYPPAIPDDRIGPALRGLDVRSDGTVYVAASACSTLLQISPEGEVSVALRASGGWSPTGVAVWGSDLFVLEYLYIKATSPEAWLPRVRKISQDGTVTVVASVQRESR